MAKKDMDARVLIKAHLKKEERSVAWLADKMKDISYIHLYFILKKKRTLTEEKREEINQILQTNF